MRRSGQTFAGSEESKSEAPACQYIFFPRVVRFLGEHCSPTLADSEHLCYLSRRQDPGFSMSQGRVPLKTLAPTKCTDYHRLLWRKSPTPRNHKEIEVEATVEEKVHLRKLPHRFREK